MIAKSFGRVLLVAGAIGLIASPAWSQNRGGQSSETKVTKEPTGVPPGGAPKGTLKLSEQDIHQVQQALERKGYKPGTGSTLDSKTREALRSFQKDNSLPVTGTIDERTCEQLGVQLHNSESSKASSSYMGSPGSSSTH